MRLDARTLLLVDLAPHGFGLLLQAQAAGGASETL